MIFDQHSKTNQFDLNASTNQYRNSFGDPLWCLEDEDGKIKVVDFLEWKCSDDK